ncbi:MAG: Rieske 2Fe-2S domain-containing protein [Chloroflexota bacterium]
MLSHEDNELLCRTGPGTPMGELFRRFWLPAMLATDLPGPDCEPWRLQILGERLVAFRDSNGDIGILDRHCPHRLADLWFGRNEERGLTCAYHGWKFDTQGNTVSMPTEPAESDFKERLKIKHYPAREFGGLIWVYMGPPELMPNELPQHEWARVPKHQRVVRSWIQESNYMQAVEGEIDSAHISFNHRWFKQEYAPPAQRVPVRTTADGTVVRVLDGAPRLTVKETDYGFIYGSRRSTGQGDFYWRCTQFLLPFYSLIPGPVHPRGGRCWVPIDDEHNMVFQYSAHPERALTEDERVRLNASPEELSRAVFKLPSDRTLIDCWRPKRTRDNDYLIDRDMQRTRNFTGITSGREQDMAMTDGMGFIPERWREHLGTTDIAIIAARRMLIRLATQLQEGVEPYAPHHADLYHIRPIDVVSEIDDFETLLTHHGEMARALV